MNILAEKLKTEVESIVDCIPKDNPIIFVDYPIYGNIGDLLIYYATKQLLVEKKANVLNAYSIANYRSLFKTSFTEDTVLIFQGGGNLGDVYPWFQNVREEVISRYHRNPSIILPQTIYFNSSTARDQAARCFGANKKLKIFARDKVSEEIGRKYFDNQVVAKPDMVHYLFRHFIPEMTPTQKTLYLIRQDPLHSQSTEKFIRDASIPRCEMIDWPAFVGQRGSIMLRLWQIIHKIEGFSGNRLGIAASWEKWAGSLLKRGIELIQSHEVVVTNRLHGMVSSFICERPVTCSDTGYGKLNVYYESWLRESKDVKFPFLSR